MSRSPELHIIPANGQQIAVWDWPGGGPILLFAHATGFHGRCWDRIIAQFPGQRCLAVEARGHGRSSKPAPPVRWRDWGPDMAAVAVDFGVRDAIGIGHSSGGHVTVQAAALRPETYGALLLIDPTIFPRALYGAPFPDVSFTLRRKNHWTGPNQMFERFKDRAPFSRWDPGILRDYCDWGLLPEGDHFVLACPPAIETSIYETSREKDSDIYAEVAQVRQPVVVMRAERTRRADAFELGASPTAPDLAAQFADGSEVVMKDATHYIAMESPDRVAQEIARLIG